MWGRRIRRDCLEGLFGLYRFVINIFFISIGESNSGLDVFILKSLHLTIFHICFWNVRQLHAYLTIKSKVHTRMHEKSIETQILV
mmetsp:Transcript_32855/g.47956  ORF Transcript_32855/g.47956 Transcript_32855/m.47956 type:complete len:85 (+) Transcript_32855:184-438(+)